MDDLSLEFKSLTSLLFTRTYLYTLFHKLLGATPTSDVLDTLLNATTSEVLDVYGDDDTALRGFARFLAGLAERTPRAELLEQSQDEYTRLFIGPAALPTPTWESPYHTKEFTFFQENTLTVRELYRAQGLQPKKMQRVPDDHIALLCAFAAHQSNSALQDAEAGKLEALSRNLRSQFSFLSEHLASWMTHFAKGVRTEKPAVLYPQLIEALDTFVKRDLVFLSEAAWWVENLDTGTQIVLGAAVYEESKDDWTSDAHRKILANLNNLTPFGIEENELAPLPSTD